VYVAELVDAPKVAKNMGKPGDTVATTDGIRAGSNPAIHNTIFFEK
jgi:hypothetical protein